MYRRLTCRRRRRTGMGCRLLWIFSQRKLGPMCGLLPLHVGQCAFLGVFMVRVRLVGEAVLALVLVLGTQACGPRVKPGLNASITVEGNDRPGERARRIVVTFDRPMIADKRLGQPPEGAPVQIEPAVAGGFRWRENRVLVFEPAAPLARATRYTVTVAKGTVAPDGFGLQKPVTHAFDTERLSLSTSLISDAGLPSAERWAVPEQRVRLQFNLQVLPAAIKRHCAYAAGDKKVAVDLGATEAADVFEVKPTQPLSLDTSWTFACHDSLAPVEGPLGLAPITMSVEAPATSADGRAPRGVYAFHTFGPLKVESVSPSGQDADPDSRYVKVTLSNPPVIAENQVPLSLTPAPEHMRTAYVSGTELLLAVGGLEPQQVYSVEVPAGLKDVFGQSLSAAYKNSFRTGNVKPGFDLETGSWSVESATGVYRGWARNVPEIAVIAAAIPPEKLFDLLPKLSWWDDEPVKLQDLKLKPTLTNLKTEGPDNRWNQVTFDPKSLLATGSTPRFVYLAAAAPSLAEKGQPPAYRQVLINITNLGVTSKLAGGQGQVWVTRLSDGKPQPGAEVLVRDRSGKVKWRGRTDSQGLAKTPGLPDLLKEEKDRAPKSRDEDEEGHFDEEEGGWGTSGRLLVFAQLADDITFVDPEKTGGFAGWHFSVPVDSSQHKESLRGFMHTDRGLYRPGETVSMRGLVRKMVLGRGLVPVAGQTVDVKISNPKGEQVMAEKLLLSRYGSWHAEFKTSEDALLGDYHVSASLPEGSFSGSFQVEEFRPNTFEVKLDEVAQDAYAGDVLKLMAEGRYFYGAPVRGGDLKFAVHGRSRWVSFEKFSDFQFSDDLRFRHGGRAYGVESFWTEEETLLSDDGKGTVSINLPPHSFSEPTTLMVSATVQDESNQAVTAHMTVPVHPARFYLGVDTGGWMAPAKVAKTLRFVAVNAKGDSIATKANLVISQHKWRCAFEAWGYRGSYRCEEDKKDLITQRLDLTKDAPAQFEFTPPEPGEYWVRLEGHDRSNTKVQASSSLWVWGEGESAWSVDESGRFDLVADKASYVAGDVARLLPKTSLAGATALVSIEREGVLETRLLTDLQDGQAIEVPITESFTPNAYVSVLLSRGRTQAGSRGLPKLTMGLVNLPVAYNDRSLNVSVNTDKATYRPGETVTATIKVGDAQGKPVRAEVALSAADEGVLSLINFATPDPLSRFYAPWGLGVMTATQLERLAQVPEPDQDRYVTGGDSAGAPGTFRARFRATAYWHPGLETDEHGQAQVSFVAPDNLTAFRLMAVAADTGDRFGHADRRFAVNKPLQLLSALPRFASVGDAFDAAVVVTNETAQAGDVTVKLLAEGLNVLGPKEQTVPLPAQGRVRVAFAVAVKSPGNARLRFAAKMGGEQDGLEQSFPLHYPTPPEAALVSAGNASKETRLAVNLPEGTVPGSAILDVSLDPDGLAGIEESLRDLVQYPYGCLEQTTSRLIPLVAVEELARSLGLPELEGPNLQRYIRIAIEKIGRHQTHDGGFSLWQGGEAEPYLTAFALWGLKLSQEAGHPVDATRVADGLAYLKRSFDNPTPHQPGIHDELGELGSRAFALYVLDLYKQGQAGHAANLYEKRNELPYYGLAFLARALAGSVGVKNEQVTDLVAQLQALVPAGTETPLIQERKPLPWYMSSHARTTAIVADALLALNPQDQKVPALVQGLLKERRGGTWRSTQENLYALVALTNYAKSNAGKGAHVIVRLGDKELLSATLAKTGAGRLQRVSVPLEGSGPVPALVLMPREGQVFYQARLRYRRDSQHQDSVQSGFTLERSYLDPTSGALLSRITAGEMVRVRLTFTTPEARRYVALTDWLPAGLEVINARFSTSADAKEDPDAWRDRLWSGYRELRDERVSTFSDWVYREGRFNVEYLARATTVGTFVVPSATVEEMYEPEVRGRVALGQLRIVNKGPATK